jgi:hypothetical protein
MARVFISYSHRPPDADLALDMYKRFNDAGHESFRAPESIQIGETWSDRIGEELKLCDYFVILLSEHSNNSDMVVEEVRVVKHLRESREDKRPVILPIRVKWPMNKLLNYDLGGYLNRIQQLPWESDADTDTVMAKMLSVIEKKEHLELEESDEEIEAAQENADVEIDDAVPLPNAPLELPGDKIQLSSSYYVARDGEREFIDQVLKPKALLRIKGPKQFGKTSLMSRIIKRAKENDHMVIPLSFKRLNVNNINQLDNLLIQLCILASRKLKLADKTEEYWSNQRLDPMLKCTYYFEEYLLDECDKPVLLVLEEADRLFEFSKVSDDFFYMLRDWYQQDEDTVWDNLKIVVSHSTEVKLAITDMNSSPFNVGVGWTLKAFTRSEVKFLIEEHGLTGVLNDAKTDQLMEMIGGHPFLIRKALYQLAKGETSFEEFMESAPKDDGPYRDHLRRVHWILSQHEELVSAMKKIVRQSERIDNEMLFYSLEAAGLVKGNWPDITTSFKLYEIYFKKRL